MATEYKLSYTASEIDEKLGKVDEAITFASQDLTEEQKAQARDNIGATVSTIGYAESKTVYLGENVLGSATLGSGWTSASGGYTHAKDGTEDLTLTTNVEAGQIYLLRFKTSYKSNEFVRVGLGDQYRVRCYQGGENIVVPLYATENNATLYFTPDGAKPAFTITDLTLCKIQDSGEKVTLNLYNTTTENHTKNYGFYNNLIGGGTAVDAVGSTRCVAIGYNVLKELQGGHRNIGIGTFAMQKMVGGEENISIGSDSMLEVKNAEGNVAIGMAAMYHGKEPKNNVAIGKSALQGEETSEAHDNVAIGNQAGYKNTSYSNVFLGSKAGYHNNNYSSVFIGHSAGSIEGKESTGSRLVIIGQGAGATAGKDQVTAIGYMAEGRGSNTTAIGARAVANQVNQTVIGYNAVGDKANQAVIGNDSVEETLLKGNLVVRGTDGVKRQIVFNEDGTCSWTSVT